MHSPILKLIALAAIALIGIVNNIYAAPSPGREFDHFATGFPLTGRHVSVACEACHLSAVFKGTPKTCKGCHNNGATPGKHNKHIMSDDNCDNCHTTFSWQQAAMDHNSVLGSCSTCHNGSVAEGKPPRHIMTNAGCDECHGTVSWVPARFNHDNITGRCDSCHNGRDATGKHASHLATTLDCGECHNTTTWTTAGFNHNNIDGRRCDSCHNGVNATGKHAQHVLTSDDCGMCHNTNAWTPAMFDHSNVVGTCSGCHIDDKPNNHFITSRECNACHVTTTWTTARYLHSGGDYPGDHNSTVRCIDCHTANSEIATWPSPVYRPDCAGCHESDYKIDSHKHLVNGVTVNYTVSELRNCAGSCHKEDKLVTQKHRVTDGGW
ncbi:MAG: hypothetical protein L0Z73_06105 [Gammaproteobacteria bacterium]|nr:hypothetical protein [Gammaproteobacteria bacterium]